MYVCIARMDVGMYVVMYVIVCMPSPAAAAAAADQF